MKHMQGRFPINLKWAHLNNGQDHQLERLPLLGVLCDFYYQEQASADNASLTVCFSFLLSPEKPQTTPRPLFLCM